MTGIPALDMAILALATWRLSHMLAHEDGPWEAWRRLRARAGAIWGPNVGWQSRGFWGQLLICPLCLSIWIAALFVSLTWIGYILWPLVVILAVSGAASWLELVVKGR